jgi:hypothetical protein
MDLYKFMKLSKNKNIDNIQYLYDNIEGIYKVCPLIYVFSLNNIKKIEKQLQKCYDIYYEYLKITEIKELIKDELDEPNLINIIYDFLPTEEITVGFTNGGQYFSKLGIKNDYNPCDICDKISKIHYVYDDDNIDDNDICVDCFIKLGNTGCPHECGCYYIKISSNTLCFACRENVESGCCETCEYCDCIEEYCDCNICGECEYPDDDCLCNICDKCECIEDECICDESESEC